MELNTWTDAQYAIAALYRDYSMLKLENTRLQTALAGRHNNSILEASLIRGQGPGYRGQGTGARVQGEGSSPARDPQPLNPDPPEVTLRQQVIYLSERLDAAERDAAELRVRVRSAELGSSELNASGLITPNPEPRTPNPEVPHASA